MSIVPPPVQPAPPKPPWRFPAISEGWDRYLTFLLLVTLPPFVPILAEYLILRTISEQSIALFAAMFVLSMGVISKSRSTYSLTVLIAIIFWIIFGVIMQTEKGVIANRDKYISEQTAGKAPSLELLKKEEAVPYSRHWAFAAVFLILGIHIIERYNRHVADRQPAFEFDT